MSPASRPCLPPALYPYPPTALRLPPASSAARWERLQREKEELERSFERELLGLQAQQEAELGALEEGLRARHRAEMDCLQDEHRAEMDRLHARQQEQVGRGRGGDTSTCRCLEWSTLYHLMDGSTTTHTLHLALLLYPCSIALMVDEQ